MVASPVGGDTQMPPNHNASHRQTSVRTRLQSGRNLKTSPFHSAEGPHVAQRSAQQDHKGTRSGLLRVPSHERANSNAMRASPETKQR